MPIPSLQAFKSATRHQSNSKVKSRGRIRQIDHALEAWHMVANGMDGEMKLAAAYALLKECKKWISVKEVEIRNGNAKDSTIIRMDQVKKLEAEAEIELSLILLDLGLADAYNRFERRKQDVRDSGQPGYFNAPGRSLYGVYQHERALYLQSKKTRAPSATLLHEQFKGQQKFQNKVNTPFTGLTLNQYKKLDKLTKRNETVLYFNKIQRLKFMVFPVDGCLCDVHDNPITTNDRQPYAIDRYGNMFVTEKWTDLPGQVNHSSFNAGREVICAGVVEIDEGRLVLINSSSGHYKPTLEDLINALIVLSDGGVDLSETTAGCYAVVPVYFRYVKGFATFTDASHPEAVERMGLYYRTFNAEELLANPDTQNYEESYEGLAG